MPKKRARKHLAMPYPPYTEQRGAMGLPDRERIFVVVSHPDGAFNQDEAGSVPVPDDMPGVAGVFVGGCVARGGVGLLRFEGIVLAHAHIGTDDPHENWVCFQLPRYLRDEAVRKHELAHIISRQGHTDKWRAVMADLGQPIPRRYQRRVRRNPRV